MTNIEIIRLDIPASLKYLSVLSTGINEILQRQEDIQDLGIISYNVQLAVQEVCTNIVEHAYKCSDKPATDNRILVNLIITSEPTSMTIEMRDTGQSFDPAIVKEPDLEEAQVHGYGLYLIHNLMDRVDYVNESGYNLWRLVKNL